MNLLPSPALPSRPALPVSPLDPAFLAQMASAMFGALPGACTPGKMPGANLIPAAPSEVFALGNRAPSMSPPAPAGPSATAAPYYFLEHAPDHSAPAAHDALDALATPALARARATPRPAAPQGPALAPSTPRFYFLDEVVLPAAAADADDGSHPAFDVQAVRRDFPTLQERINGQPLVWFDNAATTHKPQAVIDRIARFYAHENSNIHRAAHALAGRATDAYEGAREIVRRTSAPTSSYFPATRYSDRPASASCGASGKRSKTCRRGRAAAT